MGNLAVLLDTPFDVTTTLALPDGVPEGTVKLIWYKPTNAGAKP